MQRISTDKMIEYEHAHMFEVIDCIERTDNTITPIFMQCNSMDEIEKAALHQLESKYCSQVYDRLPDVSTIQSNHVSNLIDSGSAGMSIATPSTLKKGATIPTISKGMSLNKDTVVRPKCVYRIVDHVKSRFSTSCKIEPINYVQQRDIILRCYARELKIEQPSITEIKFIDEFLLSDIEPLLGDQFYHLPKLLTPFGSYGMP